MRSNVAGSQKRLMQLFQITKSFQDKQVYAALHQGHNLFTERFTGFIPRSLAQRFNANPQWPHRAGYQHLGQFFEIEGVCGFAGQPRTLQIDFADFFRQSMPR